jgi:hypothetical protein
LFVRPGQSELDFQTDVMDGPSDAEMHFAEPAYNKPVAGHTAIQAGTHHLSDGLLAAKTR